MGELQNGSNMQDPDRKITQRQKNQATSELSKRCDVCGRSKGRHTRKEAKACEDGWPEVIKVK